MTDAPSGLAITAIETVRVEEHSNVLWVLVETDEGITGLGETFFMPAAVEAYIHEWAAPRLIGHNPLRIDRIARDLQPYLGTRSASAEMRGNSAIDIALWDVFGKASGLSVVQLLGGKVRDDIATYNTCAGTEYMRRAEGQSSRNWSLGASRTYDDLNAFLTRADELACELVEEGYAAMKIWPFDMAAERNAGLRIDSAELKAALDPFERIRRQVGDKIDVMVEFHSLWSLPAALKITRALEPYGTFWHEDPMRMDSLPTLRRYADVSKTPVCASELLYGRAGFKDLFEAEVAGFATLDLSWCGGISEARKIAAMAEAWQLPVAPHDCTGPIVLCASTHVALNATNAVFQESVRAFYRTWYADAVTQLPPIAKGRITVPPGPGLGTELHPDLDRRFTASRRRSGRGA